MFPCSNHILLAKLFWPIHSLRLGTKKGQRKFWEWHISMICLCSKYVKNCNIFGQILNIWVKLILKKNFKFFFQCLVLPKDPQSFGSQNLRCPFSVSQYYRRRRLCGCLFSQLPILPASVKNYHFKCLPISNAMSWSKLSTFPFFRQQDQAVWPLHFMLDLKQKLMCHTMKVHLKDTLLCVSFFIKYAKIHNLK